MADAPPRQVRYKLAGTLLTTYGFTLVRAGGFDPVTKHVPLNLANVVCLLTGLVFHALALFLAPRGERP